MNSLVKFLADGTKVSVENNGGDMVQVCITKGGVHRAYGLSLAEAAVLTELLNQLSKPEPR